MKVNPKPGAVEPPHPPESEAESEEPAEDAGEPDILDTLELEPIDDLEADDDSGDDDSGDEVAEGELVVHDVVKELVEHDGPFLFDARSYQQRWDAIQIGFVDEPMYAVESAGRLLAEVLGEVASTFASRRKELESQWRHDREISTEELRLAFRGYRAFFQRITAL